MVWSDAYEGAYKPRKHRSVRSHRKNIDDFGNYERNRGTVLSVQLTNNIVLVTSSGGPAEPSVCELRGSRPRNGLHSASIDDVGNQMDGQNDEGDCVDDGGRVADVEAKGWGRHQEDWGRDH